MGVACLFCTKMWGEVFFLSDEVHSWARKKTWTCGREFQLKVKKIFFQFSGSKITFFHFSRNSLPQVHVFFRAQEKISSLRKKSSSHFLVLKTHATPISAHFEQNTPKNVRKKISLGKFFSQNFLDGLRGQKNTKKIWEKNFPRERNGKWTSLGKIFSHFFP